MAWTNSFLWSHFFKSLLQFTSWPNYGVPKSSVDVANFVESVHDWEREMLAQQDGVEGQGDVPLIVHCSGGLGRSGSFVTIYTMYDAILKGKLDVKESTYVNLVDVILRMRKQRHPWMVEGAGQYKICNEAILELMRRSCEKVATALESG